MKSRVFWIILCLIAVSWVLNSIYAHSKRLDEPIFLDHYVETFAQEYNQFTFYYLTNKNDRSSPTFVTIGDITGYVEQAQHIPTNFFDDFNTDHDVQTFTHHVLRRIDVTLPELNAIIQEETFSFKEMEVAFSDGRQILAPIGEVVVHAHYPDDDPLDSWTSSSSNTGKSQFTYKAEEALAIEDVMLHFEEILQEDLLIKMRSSNEKIRNEDITDAMDDYWGKLSGIDVREIEFPYELEKDETLILYTQIPPDFPALLEPLIALSGITESGRPFTHYTGFNSQPYLEQADVNRIIEQKKEEGLQ